MKSLALAAFLTITATAAASAQPADDLPSPLQALEECRSIPEVPERVRCYDAAAAALSAARAAGKVVILDPEQVRRTRRSLFGFNLPRLPLFSGDRSQEEEEQKEFEATIRSIRFLPKDKWQLGLDSGAVWQTTEVAVRQGSPKIGESVRIRKAALGSYMLSVNGRRGVRAMRVR